jgi:hypothetical protein
MQCPYLALQGEGYSCEWRQEGYLSLWDADCEEGNGFHMYLPHSAPVSGIATAPFSVEKVQFLSWSAILFLFLVFSAQVSGIATAPFSVEKVQFLFLVLVFLYLFLIKFYIKNFEIII